jgi:hypothetical protein
VATCALNCDVLTYWGGTHRLNPPPLRLGLLPADLLDLDLHALLEHELPLPLGEPRHQLMLPILALSLKDVLTIEDFAPIRGARLMIEHAHLL